MQKHAELCAFCLEFATPLDASKEFDLKYFYWSTNQIQKICCIFKIKLQNCKVLTVKERLGTKENLIELAIKSIILKVMEWLKIVSYLGPNLNKYTCFQSS